LAPFPEQLPVGGVLREADLARPGEPYNRGNIDVTDKINDKVRYLGKI
jgi:hypothetical protein